MAFSMRSALLRQSCNLSARSTRYLAKPLITESVRAAASRPTLSILSRRSPLAKFHASAPTRILPPGPQVVHGTVNDPAPVPKPSPTHGSYHWTFERALSVALVPITIAPFAYGSLNPVLDSVFIAAMLIHSHIGFTSIIIDYVPNKQHPLARKIFEWGLKAATLVVGVGFYEFETNDVGLTEGIRRIWKAGSSEKGH